MATCLTATVALLALCALPIAHAGVMAVGKLQSCVNDGSAPGTSLTCSRKIVVAVTLENNKLYETEQLNFTVACVNSPTDTCPCPCDYATDPTCTCRDLKQNIVVVATKSAVFATYPLTYGRQFNGRPYEVVIQRPSCLDSISDSDPTCGWAQDYAGGVPYNIQDSQGFCCRCSFLDILNGAGEKGVRGGLKCAEAARRTAASCLRYDDSWWWSGFTIGSYILDFSIALNVTTYTANGSSSSGGGGGNSTGAPPSPPSKSAAGAPSPAPSSSGGGGGAAAGAAVTSRTEVLRITPAQPFVTDSSRKLSAKLLGDLESYAQIPNLAGRWLMVPTPINMGPNDAVRYNRDEWMIIDSSMVTMSGECDKIGVGYSAFRNQANRCEKLAGTCLKNQIADLYFADVKRMDQGLDPIYFVGRYGGGSANTNQMVEQAVPGGRRLSLSLPLPAIKTSLLTLSVSADDVALVTNVSPARILSAQVCAYASSGICGGFETLATKGYLLADVQNAGYVAADYTLSVVNCTIGVLPVPAQYASIAPQAIRRFTFELQMETDQAIANASCSVAATDARGVVSATTAVTFYTNATKYDPVPGQSDIEDEATGPGTVGPDYCAATCPNLLNVKCSLANSCYGRLAKGLGALSSILAGLTLFGYAVKQGWVTTALRVACSCCCRRDSNRASARTRDDGGGGGAQPGPRGRKKDKRGSSYLDQAGEAAKRSLNAAADRAMDVLHALRLHQLGAFAATTGVAMSAPPPPPPPPPAYASLYPGGQQQQQLQVEMAAAPAAAMPWQQQRAYQPVPTAEAQVDWRIVAARAQQLAPPPASPAAAYALPGQAGGFPPLLQPTAPRQQQEQQQQQQATAWDGSGSIFEQPSSPLQLSPDQMAMLSAVLTQQQQQQAVRQAMPQDPESAAGWDGGAGQTAIGLPAPGWPADAPLGKQP